jgi:hypothetical protein
MAWLAGSKPPASIRRGGQCRLRAGCLAEAPAVAAVVRTTPAVTPWRVQLSNKLIRHA